MDTICIIMKLVFTTQLKFLKHICVFEYYTGLSCFDTLQLKIEAWNNKHLFKTKFGHAFLS
jgi:hypothetical protein